MTAHHLLDPPHDVSFWDGGATYCLLAKTNCASTRCCPRSQPPVEGSKQVPCLHCMQRSSARTHSLFMNKCPCQDLLLPKLSTFQMPGKCRPGGQAQAVQQKRKQAAGHMGRAQGI